LPEFLILVLKSKYVYSQLVKQQRGVAQINISLRDLSELIIKFPSMDKQKQIVQIRNASQTLIDKRKQQIEECDELVKSRFSEIRDDYNLNPHLWEVKSFQDVILFQEGPGIRYWQFRDDGIKLINIKNIVNNKLCLDNTSSYLDTDEVNGKYQHFLLNEGDFVMASSGVTWGKIAEVKEEHLPLCLNTSMIRLVSKDEAIVTKEFLFYFIQSNGFRNQINRLITGSAQPNFGPSHLKKINMQIPRLQIQSEFAELVKKVEKQKLLLQQSLNELDKSFLSFLNEAFHGEL
jgi:restriction endonuclease S subunit